MSMTCNFLRVSNSDLDKYLKDSSMKWVNGRVNTTCGAAIWRNYDASKKLKVTIHAAHES